MAVLLISARPVLKQAQYTPHFAARIAVDPRQIEGNPRQASRWSFCVSHF
jgi:hypothetical protein